MISQLSECFRLITNIDNDISWILQVRCYKYSEINRLPISYWRNADIFRSEDALHNAMSQLGIPIHQ